MHPDFMQAMKRGTQAVMALAGESFEWLGEEYQGVAQEAGVDVAMLEMGGRNSKAEWVLTCSREQFDTVPAEGAVILWRGGSWKVTQVRAPGDLFSVILHVTMRVR